MNDKRLLMGFYGDDFTGSTDALEVLTLAGVPTLLFPRCPTPEQLATYPGIRAVGVAGTSRSMTPTRMTQTLLPVFEQLRALNPVIVHYKTCSTFDSSPEIGNIGRATEIGHDTFGGQFVPLLVGAPRLGRYCAFGNLFARSGLESDVYRLDRHPTMSRHPVTPMDESDLRIHLGRQTSKSIALFDVSQYDGALEIVEARLEALLNHEPEVVLFDVMHDDHLPIIGRLIWKYSTPERPLFTVGSSGIEYALTAYWQAAQVIGDPPVFAPLDVVRPIIVVSGSCSPVTARQIDHAQNHGFATISLDTPSLVEPDDGSSVIEKSVAEAIDILQTGRNIIIHTCTGPDDPRIRATTEALNRLSAAKRHEVGPRIGKQLGTILSRLLERTPIRRVIVAGGDTSGYVAEHLDIDALSVVTPLAPGSPLCRVHASGRALDGLEIVFKGGQTGKIDYFSSIMTGSF